MNEVKDGMVGAGVKFQRIRRITGYLVGTTDRFNNGKRAEERDRVKHDMADEWAQKADAEIEARASEYAANNPPPPGCHYDSPGPLGEPGVWSKDHIAYIKNLAEQYDARLARRAQT